MRRDPVGMTYAARGLAVDLGRADSILDDDALLKVSELRTTQVVTRPLSGSRESIGEHRKTSTRCRNV